MYKKIYVCNQCSTCLFYNENEGFGESCYFYTKEGEYPQPLTWISGNDMDKNPELYDTYLKPCQGFISKKETLKEKKQEVYRSCIERILVEVI